jgi:D-sedoheptulose 7-phosphate isomerase
VENIIRQSFDDLKSAINIAESFTDQLLLAAKTIADCLTNGGVIYLCGNGGSAAEAQHFAAEFVGRFLMERPGLPAAALTTDTSKLTAIGNDYGFDQVFARQIKALGKPGDVLWGLSTSGVSPNVIAAIKTAKDSSLKTIFFCGPQDPPVDGSTVILKTPGATTPRIQELHLFLGHTVCQLVDGLLFENRGTK